MYQSAEVEEGAREMQKIMKEDAGADTEALAKGHFVCAVSRLSQMSQKSIDYLYKSKELIQRKQKFKSLLKQHFHERLKNSQKIKKKAKVSSLQTQITPPIFNQSIIKGPYKYAHSSQKKQLPLYLDGIELVNSGVVINRGKQAKNLDDYLSMMELQKMNNNILKKQKSLIQKFGFTNDYQSITNQKSAIRRKNRKVHLPQIRSLSNIFY